VLLLALTVFGCRNKDQVNYDSGGLIGPDSQVLDPDLDGDGVPASEDCDDGDTSSFPGAPELCDGVDNDCDGDIDDNVGGTWYADADGDGFGDPETSSQSCEPGDGQTADASDCDDTRADVNLAADELCNGLDDDCDGQTDEASALDTTTLYADADGDGFGDPTAGLEACEHPSGYTADDGDCDDSLAEVNPDASEVCNGIDDDCDGRVDPNDSEDASTWYADADADEYGAEAYTKRSCDPPSGYVSDATDCDDSEGEVNPAATEICNEIDDDCDGDIDEDVLSEWYLDADSDGYGTGTAVEACAAPTSAYVADDGDCDDTDTDYNPGATEGCDGEDYDCDGDVDNDGDGDGYADSSCGGDDCDDSDSSIKPDGSGGCAYGTSCEDVLSSGYTSDGSYEIDPDGYASGEDPETVYCDMTSYSGGWTLIAVNAGDGSWSTTSVISATPFGSVDLTADYKADVAWNVLTFSDVMFTDGSETAVYEGVDAGTRSWFDFVNAVPLHNCGTTDGYDYAMTDGDFVGDCNTTLYIHPIDEDGGYNASCTEGYTWGDDATGPAWSASNNDGCPMDDPSGSSFINHSLGPWSGDPLLMYVR
jgi:hypothetical protein